MKSNGVLNADKEFEWTKGPASGSPLPAEVVQYLDQIVYPYYFKLLDQEDDKEVIERTLESLRDLVDAFGPAVFANCMDRIGKYIILFLEKKAYCQTNVMEGDNDEDLEDVDDKDGEDDDEEEEEEDDGIDHDEMILGNTTDLVLWIARSLGNEFLPIF